MLYVGKATRASLYDTLEIIFDIQCNENIKER